MERKFTGPSVGFVILLVTGLVALPGTSLASGNPPAVSPIEARFDGADLATRYSVAIDDPEHNQVTVEWSLKPPANDPTCKVFSSDPKGPHPTPLVSEAKWDHSNDDGCHHAGTDHPGVVTVKVTDGTTTCTATYNGSGDGFGPAPTCDAQPDFVNVDMAAGNDPATSDCEVGTPNNPDREATAMKQVNTDQALAAENFHRICAAAFKNDAGSGLGGAQITFTIQGPGRIFASNPDGRCSTDAVPPAGTTITVTADNNGIAFGCLYSQQVGRTTVTASSGSPAQTSTGTLDWRVAASTARFIQLCHGDVAGATCETDDQANQPNDEHEMTVRVTDAQGNPVANVPVQFRETGPGIFTPQGGSTATVLTDANGLASIILTSDVEGTSTVVAEISPEGTEGSFRSPGTTDACEQPAGPNNQPPAGNCISQTLTKLWDEEVSIDPQCDDGIDNDGDGFIDFGEDPGCIDAKDDSELPVDPPPPPIIPHDRSISIRFNDGTGARGNGLVVFGRLRAPGFPDCREAAPVNVQRRVGNRWVRQKSTTTNRRGRYAVEIFDQASRYRAVAPRTELEDLSNNEVDICRKAIKAKRHRHRR